MPQRIENFLGKTQGVPKRVLPVFFLVDTSGSMRDGHGSGATKIGQVNSAFEEIIPELRSLSDSQADVEIRMSIMTFSTGVHWETTSLMTLDSFEGWEVLKAKGFTQLGAALDELNRMLSKNGFMSRSNAIPGFYAPIIIILSDGSPTDDIFIPLQNLKQNRWYQAAIIIAVAIGDDANTEVLGHCVRNKALVFTIHDLSKLKKALKTIAVASSQIASSSLTTPLSSEETNINDVRPIQTELLISDALNDVSGLDHAFPDATEILDDWD